MAKISITKILSENFKDLTWMPRLLGPVNQLIDQFVQALSNQLTFGDNFDGVVKTLTVDGTFPVKFLWNRSARPTGAWIAQVREVSGSHTNFATALFLDWEYDGAGSFVINAIPGLSASALTKYNVTIIAVAG